MHPGPRSAWSCENCRRRKVKCTSEDPCKNCIRRNEECKWPANAHVKQLPDQGDDHSQELTNLRSRVSQLEDACARAGILHGHSPAHESRTDTGTWTAASRVTIEESVVMQDADRVGEGDRGTAPVSRQVEIGHLTAVQNEDQIQLEVHKHDDFDHHIIDVPSPLAKTSRMSAATRANTRSILARALPEQSLCDRLLQSYLRNVEWIHHPLHVPRFQSSYDAFWQTRSLPDLQWLALLLVVLCLGSHFSENDRSVTREEELYRSAQELLLLSDHLSNHSLTTIQTLILMGLWLNNRGLSNTHHAQLGLAIKLAMNLGLGKIDASSSRSVDGDVDFFSLATASPDSVAADTELKRRLWWSLVCQDYYTASNCNFMYTIHPSQCKTKLFANLDEHDLPLNDADVSSLDIPELAVSASSTSYHLLKIPFARVAKGMIDLYNEDRLSYDAVLDLERLLWSTYDALPSHFKWDSPETPIPKTQHARGEHLAWQRLFLGFTVHNRVLRLHRPFMAHGYSNPSMVHSRQATIQSALACIDLAEQGQKIGFPGLKWWVVLIHVFTSGVALCIDYHFLLQYQVSISSTAGPDLSQLLRSRRRQISRSVKLLRTASSYDSVAAHRALAVLDGLVSQAELASRETTQVGAHSRKRAYESSVVDNQRSRQRVPYSPGQDDGHEHEAIALEVKDAQHLHETVQIGATSAPLSVVSIYTSPQGSYTDGTASITPYDEDWLSSVRLEDWSGPDWDNLLASMSNEECSPHAGINTDLYNTVNSFANSFMPG